MEQLHDVVAVEVSGQYRLRLTFDDGTVGEIDFDGRQWRGIFAPLQSPEYFARVTVDPDAGTVTWPNGADMAPEPLYEQVRQNASRAAGAPTGSVGDTGLEGGPPGGVVGFCQACRRL